MTDQTPAIHISNLSKKYPRVEALTDLSLDVHQGEIFTYLGPNGAGKTTTIKILTGLLKPTQGRAEILGHDIQKEPVEAKRLIGYIPDHPYLYEKLTGRDFFSFIADLFQIDKKLAMQRMEEYFHVFGLAGAEDEFIENYSHGMRQKLVFSISLMHDPKVLIVDEPMVGLDPQSAQTLKRILKDKARNEGTAIFLSTHTLSVAEEVADRIGVLNHGNLVFLGSMEEMRQQLKQNGSLEQLFLALTLESDEK